MFAITAYTVEKMKDPFGILPGDRYEFVLELEVDEEDELHHDEGVSLRVVYVKEEAGDRIANYEFLKTTSGGYIDMEMEEDELAVVSDFCRERLDSGEEE